MKRDIIPGEKSEQEEIQVNKNLVPALICATATGGTLSTAVGIALLVNPHLGAGLWFFDFAATVVAAVFGPDVVQWKNQASSLPPPSPHSRIPGNRSIADRVLGRFPEGAAPRDDEALPDIPEAISDDVVSLDSAEASEEYRRFNSQPIPSAYDPLPRPQERVRASNSDEPQRDFSPIFPLYPEQDTLRLGQAIDRDALAALTQAYEQGHRVMVSGQRFDPHFNALLGKSWIAVANQGFGKSVLNGVMIEQAGKADLPVIVLDHKGEYGTVKELPFMNALIAGGQGRVDFLLTSEVADRFVAYLIDNRHQAIVNLPSYGDTWLAKAEIVAALGHALMRYAGQQRKSGQQPLPCLIILDEAQLYLPQDQSLLPPEAVTNPAVLADLKNAYFALVSNGRSNGITTGFATQSLTYIAKWAIKSSQIRIFGRHAERNDLDAIEKIIHPSVATRAEIESFPPGVGVVFGFTTRPMLVQFDNKQSRDLSETPRIELLRRAQPIREQHAQMPDSWGYRSMPPLPTPSQVYNTIAMQEMPPVPVKAQPAIPLRLRKALEVYKPAMSYREFGAALGIGKDAAGEIIKELKRRSLISRDEQED